MVVELKPKYQVMRVKYRDRMKTILFDYSVPLRDWMPIVGKKYNLDRHKDIFLYISGEQQGMFQPTRKGFFFLLIDLMRWRTALNKAEPLCGQAGLTPDVVLCLRRASDPVDKATLSSKQRIAMNLSRSAQTRDLEINDNHSPPPPPKLASEIEDKTQAFDSPSC